MDPLVELVVFVVAFLLLLGFILYHYSRQEEAWEHAARRLNLQYDEGGWFSEKSIRGVHRGKKVLVQYETESRGRRATYHYAAVFVQLEAPCWKGISLFRRDGVDTSTNFFGGEDREVVDSSFDSEFRIEGDLDGELRQCLSCPSLQAKLGGFSRMYGSFHLEGGYVKLREHGLFTCENELTQLIEGAVDTAAELDDAVGVGDTGADADSGDDEVLFPDLQSQPLIGAEENTPR